MSQVMATGRAAMPFSLAASANKADNKLADLNIKTLLKQVELLSLTGPSLELSMVAL